MGFFKDLGTLHGQAKQMQQQQNVGDRLAHASAQMQAASAMMAQQTAAAQAAVTGIDATATIAGVRQTGMQLNYSPVVDIDLTVIRNGLPMPVTVRETVPQVALARLRLGETLHVKVDQANPGLVWIDWYRPA